MRILKKVLIIFSFILVQMHNSHANIIVQDTGDYVQDSENNLTLQNYDVLVKQGDEAEKNNKMGLAIENFSKAEIIAKQNKDEKKIAEVKLKIGYCYFLISQQGEALTFYSQALEIIDKLSSSTELKELKVKTLIYIGLIFKNKKDYQSAIQYYEKAELTLKETNTTHIRLKHIGVLFAEVYNELGLHQKAKDKLGETKDLDGGEFRNNVWKVNYAETLFLLGDTNKAYAIAKDLNERKYADIKNSCEMCILILLSKIEEKNKEYDQAIKYAKEALLKTRAKGVLYTTDHYDRLSKLFLLKQDFRTSLKYKDSLIWAKEESNNEKSIQLYEINRAKLKLNEYQNEIKINQTNYNNNLKIYWIIIIVIVLLAVPVYLWQKNHIIKQKQRHLIVEKEKRIAENQRAIAELELDNKKNESLLLKKEMEFKKNKSELRQESLKNKISKKKQEADFQCTL